MAIVPHKSIQDRATFFDALDQAIADNRRLGGAPPGFAPLETVLYRESVLRRRPYDDVSNVHVRRLLERE